MCPPLELAANSDSYPPCPAAPEMDAKYPSVGDQDGPAGLQELEPSPVEESPMQAYKDDYFPATSSSDSPPAPPRRTDTLGLSGHGPVYYCKQSPVLNQFTMEPAHITPSSNAHSEILILRLYPLRDIPHSKHVSHTPRNPLNRSFGYLPSPNTPILSILAPRRTLRRGVAPCGSYRLWGSSAPLPSETELEALRCRDQKRQEDGCVAET